MLAMIQGLKHLTLTLEYDTLSLVKFPSQDLATFLRSASNLESLMLDCNSDWTLEAHWIEDMDQRGYDTDRLMRSLNEPKVNFASLKTLTISNAVCKQEGLESFLFRHSATLRCLTLQNITLSRTASGVSCGIQMLENLRDKLQLDHFTMKGNLNNTGVQNLLFDPGESLPYMVHGKLRSATELWLCKNADMPEVLQRVAIQPGKNDLVLPRLTEDEIIETGLYALLPNLRSVESERAQAQQWAFQPYVPSYPNLATDQDPLDWLADEFEGALGESLPELGPEPDRDEWTERFLQTYPNYNGTCSDKEFDRMAEAMEAAALAESLEDESDAESYYSASEEA